MRGIAFAARHPRLFAGGGKLMRSFATLLAKDGKIASVPFGPLKYWTRYRDLPVPRGGSFSERWQKDRDNE